MKRKIAKLYYSGLGVIWSSLKDAILIHLICSCVWCMASMSTLKPVFNETPVNVTFFRGETATLSCSVINLGSSSVVWKRVDQPNFLTVGEFVFVQDPQFSVKHIPFRDEWNLIIDHVEPKHAGRYECQVSTKADIVRFVNLRVIDEPGHDNKFVDIAGPHLVEKGHPIRLTCNASGNSRSPTDIDWYLGGLLLYNGMNRHIRIVTYPRSDVNALYSELRISKSDKTNSGTYVCQTTFYDDVLKVAKHEIEVVSTDSNNIKRGTVAEGSIQDTGEGSNNNPQNRATRSHFFSMFQIVLFMVAWYFGP